MGEGANVMTNMRIEKGFYGQLTANWLVEVRMPKPKAESIFIINRYNIEKNKNVQNIKKSVRLIRIDHLL
jgi:hypothetical protein